MTRAAIAKKWARFCHWMRFTSRRRIYAYQRRGLKRVVTPFAIHVTTGDPPELLVDERDQLGSNSTGGIPNREVPASFGRCPSARGRAAKTPEHADHPS